MIKIVIIVLIGFLLASCADAVVFAAKKCLLPGDETGFQKCKPVQPTAPVPTNNRR